MDAVTEMPVQKSFRRGLAATARLTLVVAFCHGSSSPLTNRIELSFLINTPVIRV
jgi:hypothetical protein